MQPSVEILGSRSKSWLAKLSSVGIAASQRFSVSRTWIIVSLHKISPACLADLSLHVFFWHSSTNRWIENQPWKALTAYLWHMLWLKEVERRPVIRKMMSGRGEWLASLWTLPTVAGVNATLPWRQSPLLSGAPLKCSLPLARTAPLPVPSVPQADFHHSALALALPSALNVLPHHSWLAPPWLSGLLGKMSPLGRGVPSHRGELGSLRSYSHDTSVLVERNKQHTRECKWGTKFQAGTSIIKELKPVRLTLTWLEGLSGECLGESSLALSRCSGYVCWVTNACCVGHCRHLTWVSWDPSSSSVYPSHFCWQRLIRGIFTGGSPWGTRTVNFWKG